MHQGAYPNAYIVARPFTINADINWKYLREGVDCILQGDTIAGASIFTSERDAYRFRNEYIREYQAAGSPYEWVILSIYIAHA